MDGRTNRRMDTTSYRDARTHLKITFAILSTASGTESCDKLLDRRITLLKRCDEGAAAPCNSRPPRPSQLALEALIAAFVASITGSQESIGYL